LGAALLASACGVGSRAQSEADPERVEPSAEWQSAVDHIRGFIASEMEAKGLPALSIALVDGPEVVWAEGFGWARGADSVAATARTVYRVGSVSKLFTDLAIMRLQEAGRVDLDAPLTQLLPDFQPVNPFGGDLTLRQLTSHRAGLVREPPAGHYFDDTEPTLGATVRSLAGTELVLPPLQRAKYSNAGIAVVGYALEEATGEDFAEHLRTAVLDPLGMRSSSFESNPSVRANLAEATMWTEDGRQFAAPTFELGMAPAGSMYSTVLDLGRFMSALIAGGSGPGGSVVSQASLEDMWTPQFAEPGETTGYGIGFFVDELDGHFRVRHGGAIYGFATELEVLPEAELGVVVTTSMDIANTVVDRIAELALRSALAHREGRALPEPVVTERLSPERAERLEGRYREADGSWSFDLLERGGRLLLSPAQGGSRAEVRRRGDTLVVDDRRAFGRRFVETTDGLEVGTQRWVRTPISRPAPAPPRWTGLVGEYGWDHNVLYILEDEGSLTALIEWFFRYPLIEEAPDQFRFPESGLYDGETLVFERDAEGRASKATLGGSVVFERRSIDGEGGGTFKIQPVRPVNELRAEAAQAVPPAEEREFLPPDLVELQVVEPSILLDVRYASTNNFMDAAFYDEARAFLQRPAAQALAQAQSTLAGYDLGLLVHDGYRPWYVTKMFWDATPQEQKLFVADPASGSRHNRGAAVDLTLVDRSTGQPVDMVSGYDEFSPRAFPDYPGGTSLERWHRELLREAMEDEGFDVYEWEWWHFDYGDWRNYPLSNLTFEEIR